MGPLMVFQSHLASSSVDGSSSLPGNSGSRGAPTVTGQSMPIAVRPAQVPTPSIFSCVCVCACAVVRVRVRVRVCRNHTELLSGVEDGLGRDVLQTAVLGDQNTRKIPPAAIGWHGTW